MNLAMILLDRLPRLNHLPGQDVRVDDEAAEIPEHPGDRALPGPDPPRQPPQQKLPGHWILCRRQEKREICLSLDWTTRLMVDSDDIKHIRVLAVVDPVRRHRPRADSPSVTKKNLPPFDGLSCKHAYALSPFPFWGRAGFFPEGRLVNERDFQSVEAGRV